MAFFGDLYGGKKPMLARRSSTRFAVLALAAGIDIVNLDPSPPRTARTARPAVGKTHLRISLRAPKAFEEREQALSILEVDLIYFVSVLLTPVAFIRKEFDSEVGRPYTGKIAQFAW